MEATLLKTILFEALKNRGFFSGSVCCYKGLKGNDRAELDRAAAEAVAMFGGEAEAVKNYNALYDWARYELEAE